MEKAPEFTAAVKEEAKEEAKEVAAKLVPVTAEQEAVREGRWDARSGPHARSGSKRKKGEVRKAVALVAALVALLATAMAVPANEDTLCRQTYLASGLSASRMSFEQFRASYADPAFCSRGAASSSADVP